ncbi:hypothetical protein [Agrobacterium tumefaciens]|uniref:hypothetical protein n=1 Tax=Agrobacterium tumefaciens TaxID=358 RepID=UPI001FAAB8C6|nr:hypothetical protein [Agrobacterium tumefaciens]UNZ51987.1 hypothetical protein MLE07_14325 [Agrobacterium tumefaciens]UNZ51992.1 hypothetical protein MLE07_14350 [Agrobacterium tumefaciens]
MDDMNIRGYASTNATATSGLFCSGIKGGYTWTLVSILGDMLSEAELRFGPRDMSWTILGVEFSDRSSPQIWYPGNRKHIAVQLSKEATNCIPRAVYQLAHETVHLLHPARSIAAPVLEEGLATIFSEEIARREQFNIVTSSEKYIAAASLTRELLKHDADAILKIRAIEPSFCAVTPELLQQIVPQLDNDTASLLCRPFKGFTPSETGQQA